MVYRDDFYIKKNIIGYSGNLTSWPLRSIYFYNKLEREFGHITQFHSVPCNIGRSLVRIDEKYLIFNTRERYPIQQSAVILNIDPVEISKSYEKNILDRIRRRYCLDMDDNVVVECYDNRIQHFSRNPFVSLMEGECFVRTFLSECMMQFPDKKSKYDDNY
ncbi:MAG: hypothetical protein KAH18_02980 [Psychromonas sp.]|nr:hypothetical protein [Psychromonas sp.]